MSPRPQCELFTQTPQAAATTAHTTVQTLFFIDCSEKALSRFMHMVWIKKDWLCSVFSIGKLLFFKDPKGLLFQGPCTAQCNFSTENTGMFLWNRQKSWGSAETLTDEDVAPLLSGTGPAQSSDTWPTESLPKACVTCLSYQIIVNGLPWTVETEIPQT